MTSSRLLTPPREPTGLPAREIAGDWPYGLLPRWSGERLSGVHVPLPRLVLRPDRPVPESTPAEARRSA